MTTTATLHLSADFISGVTGPAGTGTWVYLWDNQPPPDSPILVPGSTSNFTPVVVGGQLVPVLQPDGTATVTVTLTDASQTTVQGGVLYLLVQSEDPTPSNPHNDLTQLITAESLIQPNVSNWNFGYAQFEYTLLNKGADAGDLTAIPGYAQHLAVQVQYDDGSSDSRGYALSADDMRTELLALAPDAKFTYPAAGPTPSPLAGTTSMVISPSNGNFGQTFYPASNWSSYLDAFTALTAGSPSAVTLSGVTNGETDASLIWHNGQYYSYTVSSMSLAAGAWGPAGVYYEFSPTAASQTKGYILFSQATLEQNLYAAGQGTVTLWQDQGHTQPYIVPGSALPPGTVPTTNAFNPSTNNEWGNIFTNLFTGFTAGYWGTTAEQSNPLNRHVSGPLNLASPTLDLDNSQNWSPSYAFDVNRVGTAPLYQHNDSYTQTFFNNSNVYGSAFSDNLSNGLSPGPLIGLSQPGSSTNVGNIDLFAYGATEVDTLYRTPVGANYLPLPSGPGQDYLIPAAPSPAGLQLAVVAGAAGLALRPDASVQLGIYTGGGHFEYVPLQPSGGTVWETYAVAGGPGAWTAAGTGNSPGTLFIQNLPTASTAVDGKLYWYQLVFSDSAGDQKVFDFYATGGATPGQIQAGAASVAADGGAYFPPGTLTPTFVELDLAPAATLPNGMLSFSYNIQFSVMPAAPVIGTLSGGVFDATDGQNGTGITVTGGSPSPAPNVTIENAGALAFGWTGTNNGTHTGTATNPSFPSGAPAIPGLVSAFTNKIVSADVAEIGFVDATTQQPLDMVMHATADLDGQWQTTMTTQLGNGTFTVTMTELLADGVTPFGPHSAPLAITVDMPTLLLQKTPDGTGLDFASDDGLGPGGGNWLHVDAFGKSHLPQGAEVLLYATLADGTPVGRDGHTGPGATIEDATLARLGSMQDDSGGDLLKAHQTFFMPADEQLHFAVLNPDGSIDPHPATHVSAEGGGLFSVDGGGLTFTAYVDNTVGNQTYLASVQRNADLPVVHLNQGEAVQVQVAGSADNVNTLHFVRFDIDPTTFALSVGGVAYGNTDAFRMAVQANWDKGIAVQDGHGTFQDGAGWTVAGKNGFYAPVLATQNGDIFVVGTANVDGHEHIRMFGENTFGFEDLRADQHSDFDYNDMLVHITTV
jgi:hypothetical protein